MNDKSIYPIDFLVSRNDRSNLKGHQPAVLWFTGLSGSGKSTIANHLEKQLNQQYKIHTYLLDGDNIRSGINQDLGFSPEDRTENIRRIGEVCKLFHDAGILVLSTFISPYKEDRDQIRAKLPENAFFEIFVDCPIEVCQQRDPKGLYQKAINGEIPSFTGISAPYEIPDQPEIHLRTNQQTIDESLQIIIEKLKHSRIIP